MSPKKRPSDNLRIVVAGDSLIDCYDCPGDTPSSWSDTRKANWTKYNSRVRYVQPGGVLQLARLVRHCAPTADVFSPSLDGEELRYVPCDQVLRSNLRLEACANTVLRVKGIDGYEGPSDHDFIAPLPVEDDPASADIVVLDDAGNGFRTKKGYWPKALTSKKSTALIVCKMASPLFSGKLWDFLTSDRSVNKRLILILDADNLRASGTFIRRGLSWERSGLDLMAQLLFNPKLAALKELPHVVIRLGHEGAVHLAKQGRKQTARLIFDPSKAEGDIRADSDGEMYGSGAIFTAAIVHAIASGLENLEDGIRIGLDAEDRFWKTGYGKPDSRPAINLGKVFSVVDSRLNPSTDRQIVLPKPISKVELSPELARTLETRNKWTILSDKIANDLELAAISYTRSGKFPLLSPVPVGQFGNLLTLDRKEIESFRAISILIREYLNNPRPARPLCISVFGPPGSGKSFGVKQVAKSIAGEKIKSLTFNLSEFNDPSELVAAFHIVRDAAFAKETPLVFFDEFDSDDLKWLKYLLAPMQDGEFREGEVVHPIGKAIFVFAGGTCETYQSFSREQDQLAKEKDKDAQQRWAAFGARKGPDFVSRLRGFINILGPNPYDKSDRMYPIRRAVILRSLLQRNKATKQLFDSRKQALVEEGVLFALLTQENFKHGIRSIEAILDMSRLSGEMTFAASSLPTPEQLTLHVDSDAFLKRVRKPVSFGKKLDAMAREIHNDYLKHSDLADDHPANVPWDKLGSDLRESNYLQACHIAEKLAEFGLETRAKTSKRATGFRFTEAEIEHLARLEHERWCREKLDLGYRLHHVRDDAKRQHHLLYEWAALPKSEKDKDRNAVKRIPNLLALAGIEIVRPA